jgi:hypothetical protein
MGSLKMNGELLEKAIKVLNIQGVFLRKATIRCKDDFIPPFFGTEVTLSPQHRGAPTGDFAILDSISEDQVHETRTVVFNFTAGTRLVDKNAAQEGGSAELEDSTVFIEITAEFCAHYNIPADLNIEDHEAAFEEFGRRNVGYHVWPFWREYVQSVCSRMGIPPIPIPFFLVGSSKAAPDKS